MMEATRHDAGDIAPERPAVLLAGFFVGCASVALTMGTFWVFAPLFPAVTAGVAAILPFSGHRECATGALAALLGSVVFVALFAVLLMLL
jgi:hypothetical protein